MALLITGANGALGTAIINATSKTQEPLRPKKTELNIQNQEQIEEYFRINEITGVIHCAALTNLEYCEQNPKEAYLVNTLGTSYLAAECGKDNIPFTYISTEAVFSGEQRNKPYTEDDIPTEPKNVYGWTKLMGEWYTKKLTKNHKIIRLGWLFGPNINKDRKFVTAVAKALLQKKEVSAIRDIIGSPTYAPDAAEAIIKITKDGKSGIYHLFSGTEATRYDMAKEIAKILGLNNKIIPVSHSSYPSTIDRALYSALESKHKKYRLQEWKEALKIYLIASKEDLIYEIQ